VTCRTTAAAHAKTRILMTQAEYDAAVMARWPSIPWREPVGLTVLETGVQRYGCRLCIARVGLKGSEIEDQYPTYDAAAAHITAVHGA
jgi:hypothetical protein